jgi:glycerol-3-phosphate acyltransferase PlsX
MASVPACWQEGLARCRELDPQRYNGACLLGLQGVVVKSHGNSTTAGFQQAIACAVTAAERNLPRLITQRLALAAAD